MKSKFIFCTLLVLLFSSLSNNAFAQLIGPVAFSPLDSQFEAHGDDINNEFDAVTEVMDPDVWSLDFSGLY